MCVSVYVRPRAHETLITIMSEFISSGGTYLPKIYIVTQAIHRLATYFTRRGVFAVQHWGFGGWTDSSDAWTDSSGARTDSSGAHTESSGARTDSSGA